MTKRIIISGGGTGGHIFPAIAIANAIKEKQPDTEFLFVGAKGRIEMEKVPAAGYNIKGLSVSGFARKLTPKNIITIFKFIFSLIKSYFIIKKFKPNVAVGTGGYASAAVLYMASRMGVPTLIQEQNSYAGVTNKLLSARAKKICVAYEGLERFFPKDKIIITGNPVRKDLFEIDKKREEAFAFFKLNSERKTILLLGGSGGARTLNEAVIKDIKKIESNKDIQLIWQTGKYYFEQMQAEAGKTTDNIQLHAFLSRMDLAYATADIIISRSGAGTISELCLLGKPVVLVPSPNVAEDHQTKNAMALVDKNAALLVKDTEAKEKLFDETLELLQNKDKINELSENIRKLAMPDSANIIADEVLKL